ncbi:MAG: SDR family oxidoreductase [Chloroflexi bacterium]|nr:SDR family oxidoreductase [Chloroflexota bacterium]
MELKDSVVLITGAAMRVGRQVALHLASLGANISFSYYLDDEPWQETQKELEACGVRVLATQTEVRDAAQVKALVERTVQEFGKIDVLINNASIWLKSPFLEISERDWDLAMDVNLKGPFLAAQAVAPHMLKQGQGVIINITDLSAFQVWPGYAHHSASKAGLAALTKALAVELAPSVRVNAIAPGTVLLAEDAPPEKVRWSVEKSTLKRIGSPQDVARMITFLIENDFTTGAVYFVDGGRSLV